MIVAAWKIGGMMELPQKDTPLAYERPATQEIIQRKAIDSSRDWGSELASLGLISSTPEGGAVATSTATIGDVISQQLIEGYVSLKESGRFTPEKASQLGESIGESVRAPLQFVQHGEHEIKTDPNTSLERSLQYREDMRGALAGLIYDSLPEFEIFGLYIETKNPERLRELEDAALRYQEAEKATLAVIVPEDAKEIHVRAVNSLGAYADSLRQLIRYANEPLATLAVLRTYNDSEREMLYAFDALASFYVRKSKDN
jgi:hypothetical protein